MSCGQLTCADKRNFVVIMSIERLRREVEQQERRVAALREKKVRRYAVLSQVRLLMNTTDPTSFTALSNSLWQLLHDMAAAETLAVNGDDPTITESVARSASDGLFSKEMEQRIMQEEEPPLKGEWSYEDEDESVDQKKRKKRRRRQKQRKERLGGVEATGRTLALAEDNARSALLAAVDALQLDGAPQQVVGVPEWLADVETTEPGELYSGGKSDGSDKEEENVYSDDFDELSDD
ncbi:hypothetical protein, conserved [Trypanosoma brucei gambiense DAL972]|uniref:Uncharacterized protein n=1 Tax=Trypanosoma brucei gambiense (strain MHOM/CI/86/DAL972) TaxID=679716 RepID=C9ZXR6_TRYB9|nr:hypothetical protein, conserved [Trypanosoma brucei gambiense DAL972]CBH14211.1 hypothetical protein, conserved [Trypanosoma brucei gambiense DAL972]|eukprot:XP_011776481.1 hypothetical protein, conserved [Trypanosoma brucei gambiense DAL972]